MFPPTLPETGTSDCCTHKFGRLTKASETTEGEKEPTVTVTVMLEVKLW